VAGHRPWRAGRLVLLLVPLLGGGCAGWSPSPPLAANPVELASTPFHPQDDYHCGPAALATVLNASGVPVSPDDLAGDLYLPDRRGTLQIELAAAARRQGRLAVQLDGSLPAVVAQLGQGRPVVVLQNLASTVVPVWHYAVVVGYLPDEDRFVLRSGREFRQLTRRGRFAATWDRAGNWALVLLDPEEVPEGVPAGAWPDDVMARLGEANNLYYLGERTAAAEAYRTLLDVHPHHEVAVHNLIMVLLELDRACDAERVVRRAEALQGDLIDTARRAVAVSEEECPRP
jgi:hypothetical protein